MTQKWNENHSNTYDALNASMPLTQPFDNSCTVSSSGHRMEINSTLTTKNRNSYTSTGTSANQNSFGSISTRNGVEGSEPSRNILCFVCSTNIQGKNFIGIRNAMNHSHAPALALLTDVLGYKLEDAQLHSEVMCKSCFHLLDVIDELHQTLTASKTDIRTKFLDTIHQLKLKYLRTDKMLKPRCQRCVQMNQVNARKKMKSAKSAKSKLSETTSKVIAKRRIEKSKKTDKVATKSQQIKNLPTNSAAIEVESVVDVETEVSSTSSNGEQRVWKSIDIVFDTDPAMFSSNERLKVGQKNQNDTDNLSFSCFYCQRTFDSALSLKMHVRVHHMPVLVYDNGHGPPETRYRMGIKLQNCDKPDAEKPFACLFCESAYKLQSSLQSHFRDHHSPHKPFECQECKESFRRPIELSRHRLYRCPAEGNTVTRPNQVR